MNLDPYLDTITDALAAAAELGDEQTRRTAAALATAVAAPARLALLRALSDVAAEISSELGDRVVTVRLDGSDAVLEVRGDAPPETPGADRTFEDVTGDISRVTLRLVEQIKARAEEAAAQNGVSLNSWVSQAVQGALREQMRYQRRADEHATRRPDEEAGRGPSGTSEPSEREDG
ncbi:toxin-antitoxin system HicB family antitoxin [Rhodococcus sp. CSLK01-03]|uniref:Toxin-antitoxin system HicB family antitoxin n=1 Tax=Rhodococcus indonesiensis TaxID=3055869 RepID=A0ABT7RKX4_9NOCA|nr:toxin-antitoxin system HicB family antitoxin [Rhodococcus indonesiensis]MDM7487646.1 toxin-antitoxin system HicB family antitoxin [Rhodococcus indonesiensis]